MVPPPRPPIICYDLHTNNNARRKTTQTSTIPITTNSQPFTSSVRYNQGYENVKLKNVSNSHTNNTCSRYAYDQKVKDDLLIRQQRTECKKRQQAMQAELEAIREKLESLQKFPEMIFKTFGIGHTNAKHSQHEDEENAKLKQKLIRCSETRSKELGRTIQQMKLLQKFQEHQRLQKLKEEEELQRQELRRQVEQQHKKVLRDVTKLNDSNYCKHTLSSTLNNSLSSTNSSTSNTKTLSSAVISPFSLSSTCSSSQQSTISSSSSSGSSCSPSISKRYQHVPNSVRFAEPPSTTKTLPPKSRSFSTKMQHKKLPNSGYLSSSTPTKNPHQTTNKTHNSYLSASSDIQELAKKYSFYKKDSKDDVTIEVGEDEFFETVEDKTMLEVKELFNEMNNALTNLRYMSN